MRVLVTGAYGFVGRHVVAELLGHGHQVWGYDVGVPPPGLAGMTPMEGDIRNADAVKAAVRSSKPDACIHLAAMAFVPSGAATPEIMLDVNIMGTIRMLEVFRHEARNVRLLAISSAQVYGHKPRPAPVKEDDPFDPDSIYAISKAAVDQTSLLYARQYGMDISVVRPHNHIGPGQSPLYVVSAFARQVSEIARGGPQEIKVGNLESMRDFTDVRDVARAYRLLLDRGRAGEAYNLGSDSPLPIGDILLRLCAIARVQPAITRDPARFRPMDRTPVLDIGKLRAATGWMPEIPLDRTLGDIMQAHLDRGGAP